MCADAVGSDSYRYVKVGQEVPEPIALSLLLVGGLFLKRKN
jgi:hypothetical protein